MPAYVLTQYQGMILGPITKVLGYIINAIYNFLEVIGIPNIGLSIILFTVIVNVLMIPLTIKQQKFQKMTARMNPELQAVQKKYKNKKDTTSMERMNEEMNAIYEKYGASPTGGCLPLLIQMPILFALFRVINNIPAYITHVKAMFTGLVTSVSNVAGFEELMKAFVKDNGIRASLDFTTAETTKNTLIDAFYLFKDSDWTKFESMSEFSGLTGEITELKMNLSHVSNFLGLNITNTPWDMIKAVVAGGSILLAIGALMIPVLSALTQWLNTKLMGTASNTPASPDDVTANMTKSMNTTMPLMSAFFCLTFQIGLGLYWIASSAVRCVIQVIMNKIFDKVDVEDLIAKNVEKNKKKKAKRGYEGNQISEAANRNVRKIDEPKQAKAISQENEEKVQNAYNQEVKAGSIADRARMVQRFNEKNKK